MATPQVAVIYRESSRLTVDEWRKIPDMVKRAQAVLEQSDVKAMLDVLKNSHIANYGVDGFPPLETRAIIQAHGEAYSSCLHDFMSLGEYLAPKEVPQETFEPEFETPNKK